MLCDIKGDEMSKKSAAAPKKDLCYDVSMKALATPDVARKVVRRRKPLINKKHIAPPLSAEQISKGVGVTPEDAALVDKVLARLGYIPPRPKKRLPKSKAL
jgi:hypothetical protein